MNESKLIIYKIISLIIIFSQVYDFEQTCSFNIDCNDCDFCGEETEDYSTCNYDNIFCKGDNQHFYSPRLKSEYDSFFRKDSEVSEFCGKGEIEFDLQKEPVLIFDVNKNNFPKRKLVHCSYSLNRIDNYKKYEPSLLIKFNPDQNNIDLKFKIIIELTSADEVKTQKLITNDDLANNNIFEETLKDSEELLIFIDFLNNEYNSNEVLEMKYKINKKILLDLYSLILYGILGLAFIIILIIIIIKVCCPHVKCKKAKQEHQRIPLASRQVTSNRNRNIENVVISHREVKREVKKKINHDSLKLLKNSIFQEDFIQKYDNNCTICFEPFIVGKSKISITPCEHIFHMECIKKWIESNGISPYCPNCKYCFIKNKDENNFPSLMMIRRDANLNNILRINSNRNLENNENNNSHLTV